jgi:cobalamin biosynthesis Mg chelatase CobN
MDSDNVNEGVSAQETQAETAETQPAEPQSNGSKQDEKVDSAALKNELKRGGKRGKKKKRTPLRSLLRLVVALVIIAVGIYGILLIVAIAAKYDSINAMLASMMVELELMWQRIRN